MSFDRNRRAFCAGAAGALVAVFSGACGNTSSGSNDNRQQPELQDLKVAGLPSPSIAPLFIAQKRGFFKAEGLNVQVQRMPAEQVILPALRKGVINIAQSSNVPVIATHSDAQGFKMRIVSEIDIVPQQPFPVVVPADSPIRQPEDLKGKRIGVKPGTIEELGISVVLKTYGVQRKEVRFVNVPFALAPKALAKKTVDAAFVVDPYLTAVEKQGARRILDAVSGPVARIPVSVYAVTEEFAQKNPNTVAAFRRAIVKAQSTANDDQNLYITAAAEAMQADPKVIAAASGDPQYVTTTSPVRLQRVADLMYQFGYIKKRLDVRSMLG